MDTLNRGKYCYYLISLLILITGLFGIKGLITKADLPFSYIYEDDKIISNEQFDSINSGDKILSIDGINIKSTYQLETILDNHSIGEDINIEISSASDNLFKPNIHLVRYYRKLDFITISFLAGLSFWMTSVFIIVKKHGGLSATVLFWVLILFSLATMTSPGKYFPGHWMDYLVRIAHVVSYFLGAITFLHFTIVFPRIRVKSYNVLVTFLYLLSFLFCIVLISAEFISISDNSSRWVFTMEYLWNITEAVLLLSVFFGAANLYLYYRKINDIPERKKTEWIFWGLAAGVCPFLLFWLLPNLLGYEELIKEEYLLLFLIIVPVLFAMAVVKYHVFEIDVFIKRSILYSALIIITVVIYKLSIMIILFFAEDLVKEYHTLVTIFIILIEVFLLNPIQKKLRISIDRSFYMIKYDFENTVCNFSAGIKEHNTIPGLCKYVITEIEKIIPVKKIAIVEASDSGDSLLILSQNNFDELPESLSAEIAGHIKTDFSRIIAGNEKVEYGLIADYNMTEDFKKYEIDVVIPFVIDTKNRAGAIILGDKLSGLRFMKKDIEMIGVLIPNLVLAFYRLNAVDT